MKPYLTDRLDKAIQRMLHLHGCEQEGIGSGQPSPADWIAAVDELVCARGEALVPDIKEGKNPAACRKEWKYGVIEFHCKRNERLWRRFFEVKKDLTDAACIMDIWLNDIGNVLAEYGYTMKIYLPPEQEQ